MEAGRAVEQRVQSLASAAGAVWHEVGVDPQRERRVGVAEPLGDRLDALPASGSAEYRL